MDKMISQNRQKEFLGEEFVHDLGSTKPSSSLGKCMTLTKTRCQEAQGYYSSKRQRALDIADFLRLNGIKAERFEGWSKHVSRPRMGALCGNGEALNVLAPIIKAALHAIGLQDTRAPDW